jgi:hypothetical protein
MFVVSASNITNYLILVTVVSTGGQYDTSLHILRESHAVLLSSTSGAICDL